MLLIFDWDGTIADSREHIVAAMQAAISTLQLPAQTDNRCAQMIGLGLQETALKLFPHFYNNGFDEQEGINQSGLEQFSQHYSSHFTYLKKQYGPTQFFPGAIETLEKLKAQGHLLAVATGKSRRGLDRTLAADNLVDLFIATRAADETASKPNPMMLEALLNETNMSAEQAVMIGDTSYDMQMAVNIDMQRIAVSYGVHEVSVLEQYAPSLVIDRMEQLLQWPALV